MKRPEGEVLVGTFPLGERRERYQRREMDRSEEGENKMCNIPDREDDLMTCVLPSLVSDSVYVADCVLTETTASADALTDKQVCCCRGCPKKKCD